AGAQARHAARRQARRLHVPGQPRRGLGGGRVLDRALLAHRRRRLARHPQALRIAVSTRSEDDRGIVLPVDVRGRRARPARDRGKEGVKPLEYMERYGAYSMREGTLDPRPYEREIDLPSLAGARTDAQTGVIQKDGKTLGVVIDGRALSGFETPSRKL